MHTAALLYFIVCCSALAAYMAGFLTAAWWLGAERQEPHPDSVHTAAVEEQLRLVNSIDGQPKLPTWLTGKEAMANLDAENKQKPVQNAAPSVNSYEAWYQKQMRDPEMSRLFQKELARLNEELMKPVDLVQSAATKREGFLGKYTAEEWGIWEKIMEEAEAKPLEKPKNE